MDYQSHYNKLIESRRTLRPFSGYKKGYERHHIIMKSMGGVDDFINIVYLTPREHFIAHRLLWLIFRNRESAWAFRMMCTKNKKWSSKIYEELRVNLKHSKETKEKISKYKNTLGMKHSAETKLKISSAAKGKQPNLGNKFSMETKNKIGLINKDTVWINDKLKNKRVERGVLQSFLDIGWILGAKSNTLDKNRNWINNNLENKRIKTDTIKSFLNSGWKLGRINKHK